jgi:WD40 repeat protein
VSGDGRYIVSGSEDGEVKVWRSRTLEEILSFEGHRGGVSGVAISANGNRIVSTGFTDRTAKVWEQSGCREIASFTADCDLRSCAIGRFSQAMIAVDVSGQIHRLRLEPDRPTNR